MAKTYYSGLNDVNLAKDVIAKTPDLYIQKYEYIGTGVYAIETGGISTLTPATSPSWTVDEFNSTVAKNLIVYDDNSKAASGLIVDNDATSVTFDETALLLDEDVSTAATLTAGSTYNMYVLTPSSVTGQTYGPFWGYTEGVELNINDTFMKFKYSIPKKMKFKDLEEREGTITGGHINFENTDIIEDLFGAVEYGDQSGQYSYGIGSDPDTDRFYRLTFVGTDRNNRALKVIVRKSQFEITGNFWQKAESGYFMAAFNTDITSDGFYPDDVDMIQVIRAD